MGPESSDPVVPEPDSPQLAFAGEGAPGLPPRVLGAGGSPPDRESLIPIHEFVRLTDAEVAVLDHPAVQRLGETFQLGQTRYVFRGGTHERLEHALGTVHVAQVIIDSLERNLRAKRKPGEEGQRWILDQPLTEAEIAFTRLAALLHDVGHLPAGHTLEDELALLDQHDGDERLNLIFDRAEWRSLPGLDLGSEREETLRARIDRLYRPVADAAELTDAPSELVLLLVSAGRAAEAAEQVSLPFRAQVCRDIIGNTICADLVDYLCRDWHHLGKPRQIDSRLIDYMELRRSEQDQTSALVVYLRRADNVRTDAVSAILDLLEDRYLLFEIALYHRTKVSATAMLERVIAELTSGKGGDQEEWLGELTNRLLECSDAEMEALLATEAVMSAKSASGDAQTVLERTALIARRLRLRRFHKPLHQMSNYQLAGDAAQVQALYAPASRPDPAESRALSQAAARNRHTAMRQLEADFGLQPLSLVMYCPPRDMSTKIADVRILLDDQVYTLAQYENEAEGDSGLTGGHLAAQQKRFRRLWRIFFACEADALADLDRKNLKTTLIQAIECFVLGRSVGATLLEDTATLIATQLAANAESPWFGRSVERGEEIAARDEPIAFYPTGLAALAYRFQAE